MNRDLLGSLKEAEQAAAEQSEAAGEAQRQAADLAKQLEQTRGQLAAAQARARTRRKDAASGYCCSTRTRRMAH